MRFGKKFLILIIGLVFLSSLGIYSALDYENSVTNVVVPTDSTADDAFGCCSIVLQLENNDTVITHRRDSPNDADVHIEQIDWHGIPAIKQYKEDGGYFMHVIITENGWVIGQGGIDDGEENQKIDEIAATLITEDNSISEDTLAQIQEIKKPFGRGHIVVKAPNGNYGFANVDMLKTGKLEPGQYISIPNNYSLSRSGNVSLDSNDTIHDMVELARTDQYGDDRREIVTYDVDFTPANNTINIYVSNEDGAYVGVDNSPYIDDIYINDTLISGKDIPVAPQYTHIGSFTFASGIADAGIMNYVMMGIVVVFICALSVGVYRFVRFIKFKK